MTDAERKAKLKERVKTLKEMRDVMMNSEQWESMKRLIEAVTAGAMDIQRIIKEDFGEENSNECAILQGLINRQNIQIRWCERY